MQRDRREQLERGRLTGPGLIRPVVLFAATFGTVDILEATEEGLPCGDFPSLLLHAGLLTTVRARDLVLS